ncbi:MAG TPA: hypothetical protein VGK38_03835 [Prolixibacteraceae bacterium]|jgi:hypothetical protein
MNSKQITLSILFSAITLFSVAQMKFVDGYIVTNNHKKTDCLIRNSGNAESLMNFEYKLNGNKKIEKIELAKIEEFGIKNELRCVRALIKIDASPDRITQLKDTINSPEWEEGHAYLKMLVDGKLASLYSYFDEGKTLFFYSKGNSAIEPLFYKESRLEITPGIIEKNLTNNTFRNQLAEYLDCRGLKEVSKISYSKKDLVQYFIDYHKCKAADFDVPKNSIVSKGSFRLKLGTSLNRIKMEAQDYTDASKISFSPENSLGFGIEAEYLLPFNNYKWSFFAESNYYSYKSDYSDNVFNQLHDGYIVDYKTIELPVGITYYLNVNQNQRLFLRGAFVPDFILSGSYIAFHSEAHYSFAPASRMLFGIGYNCRQINAEIRYYSGQNITQNTYKRGSDLSQISFRVSYILYKSGKR